MRGRGTPVCVLRAFHADIAGKVPALTTPVRLLAHDPDEAPHAGRAPGTVTDDRERGRNHPVAPPSWS